MTTTRSSGRPASRPRLRPTARMGPRVSGSKLPRASSFRAEETATSDGFGGPRLALEAIGHTYVGKARHAWRAFLVLPSLGARTRGTRGRNIGRILDMPILAVGGLASGALALGMALLLEGAVGTEGVGPTAATLSDAFSLFFGAAIGLAGGSACVALAARTGPPMLTGLI